MSSISYSQYAQDLFVSALLPHQKGFFLDIGCSDPIRWNNTYKLEVERDWKGYLFDYDTQKIRECGEKRKNPAIHCDANTFNWEKFLDECNAPKIIDYISLDVDEANLSVIQNFPFHKYQFKIMTFEHDRYQRGDVLKNACKRALWNYPQYAILLENALIKETENSPSLEWEDWWVNRDFIKFYGKPVPVDSCCDAKEYAKRLELLGILR